MDSRTAAHVLAQIGGQLELHGEDRFKSRAYHTAARAVLSTDTEDITPLYKSGELRKLPGVGAATFSVLKDLVETGDSSYFERLRENTPEGLLEMLRVPGMGTAKIRLIHEGLGIETLQQLEEAARDGRLAKLPRFGPRTAEKILKGIVFLKETGSLRLLPHALAEAQRVLAGVRRHPDVVRAEIAGSVRRRREVIADIDIVAACSADPAAVAASFARAPGVRSVAGAGQKSVAIRYVDGTRLDLHCVPTEKFAAALWRATGSASHVDDLRAALAGKGLTLEGDELRRNGNTLPVAEEADLFSAAGLAFIEPELREARGEVQAAASGTLPSLIELGDIQGVLHCHSQYSDGGATIAEMAEACRERGWKYLGISDHSVSAFYAGGLKPDAVLRQHDEIDELNSRTKDFVVLKGIEADILADGRVDYEEEILASFDYVIGSIHSRFAMSGAQMTQRVLRALDDPHLTILGHPTGRLLLSREPFQVDMEAVMEKAIERGVVLELNADPHRLDLDWTHCIEAKRRGARFEIGPDAHSTHNLDYMEIGIAMARKGWLEKTDVLNCGPASAVISHARRHRP
ncbi:MAG TPA: DNA polymerase/3'-5' exonuclease PolX [Gemmatimonadaceae bacterium]|nr:DNA polymerase/3'-5' exonuclease PolX [Gemmatimonadaceae bacterium]